MSKFQAGRGNRLAGTIQAYQNEAPEVRSSLLKRLQEKLDQGRPAADFTEKYGSQFRNPNRVEGDWSTPGPNIPFAPTGRVTSKAATMNPFSEGFAESRLAQTRMTDDIRKRAGLRRGLTKEEANEWLELRRQKELRDQDAAIEAAREEQRIPGMFEAKGADSMYAPYTADIGPDGQPLFKSKSERDAWINKQGKYKNTLQEMAKDYDKEMKKIRKTGTRSGLEVIKKRTPVLEYLRNDGMGEQTKRGWLMSHTFLTSLTPSMIDELDFKQTVEYSKYKRDKEGKRIPIRRFRDDEDRLLDSIIKPKKDKDFLKTPVGTTTKRSYLTSNQALDFLRLQIIQAVEEGQYTSTDARVLLNQLEDSMLEKGRLTAKGRKDLITYFANLEGLNINEATRIVDSVVEDLTSRKVSADERIKLTNKKAELEDMLALIDGKKRLPSGIKVTNAGDLMVEKDDQTYVITRDSIVKDLDKINKKLSPRSLKKVQKSFTTLDKTILEKIEDPSGRSAANVTAIKRKLEEIIERRDRQIEEGKAPSPLPFMLILEALHPSHAYNPYTAKGILFNPDGFNAGTVMENPFIDSKKSSTRMVIDPMFGVIANAVFEKYLLQTQFVPTAGEAHPVIEAMAKEGILPKPKVAGKKDKLTDTTEKEGFETSPQNEVWVPKIDPKTKKPVKGSDGSVVMQYGGVTRLAGNATIGREVFKEWKRWQNSVMGRPTDEYDEGSVSNSEYEVIGTFIRELYQRVNPDLYEKETHNDKAYYKLTDRGLRAIHQAAKAAPDAFKVREKRARTVSRNVFEGEQKGKTQVTTVVQTGKIPLQEEARYNAQSEPYKIDTLRNKLIHQIAAQALMGAKNQVTLDPIGDLFGIGPEKFAEFRGTFDRKVAELRRENPEMPLKEAQNAVWSREGENYRPEYEMDKQITKFLEYLSTVGRDSDQALYLDYVIQKLTGRMHVDQTRFNPQLIPWMRYAVGGVIVPEFHPNKPSEMHDTFKEEMARKFIPGAELLLPEERVARFNEEVENYLVKKDPNSLLAQIVNEGTAVEASLISDADLRNYNAEFAKVGLATQPTRFEEGTKDAKLDREARMSRGLSQGVIGGGWDQVMDEAGVGPEYISIPETIASIPNLDIPESLMARTRGGNVKGSSEGIDGVKLIEAAIELKRYFDAKKEYRPFRTNIQVEYDGKTHGPASMLALVGALKAAFRTGLLRKSGAKQNLDKFDDTLVEELLGLDPNSSEEVKEEVAGDIRDGMAAYMLENKRAYSENYTGRSGVDDSLNNALEDIVEAAVADRENYLKKPPMVLTYGRLLENLKEEIFEVVFVGKSKDKIRNLKTNNEFMSEFHTNKKDPNQTVDDYISDFLHTILADAIDTQLHPAVIEFGQLMRANGLIAMLTDEIMVVKNASGIDQYIGSRETVVKRDQDGEVVEGEIYVESGGKGGNNVSANFVLGKTRPAGSALRDGIPAGHVRGRGIPSVAQGIDGEWMRRLFSGKAWKAISDIPGISILPIFDAALTNIAGGAEVRRQANKAWEETVKEFYPWDYTLLEWPEQSYNKLYKRLGFDPKEKKWVSEDHANMKIPFIDFSEILGYWPNDVVKPDKSDPSTLPTKVVYEGGGRDRKEIGKFASSLEGQYKAYYYLLHDTSPGDTEGNLSLKNLYRAVDDAMIQREPHGFRPRKPKESYKDYKTEKQKHVKKVVHAMIRMIDKNVPEKQKLNLEAKLLTKDPVTTPLDGMTRKQIKNFADAIEWGLNIKGNNKFYANTLRKSKDQLFEIKKKRGDITLQID